VTEKAQARKRAEQEGDKFIKALSHLEERQKDRKTKEGGSGRGGGGHGRAVQVDSFTPTLNSPGTTERLKLKCDKLLSTSAFKLNLRRYTTVAEAEVEAGVGLVDTFPRAGAAGAAAAAAAAAAGTMAAAGQAVTSHRAAAGTGRITPRRITPTCWPSTPRKWSARPNAPAARRWQGLPEIAQIGRFLYIAWVKCPYRVADNASALRAGSDIPKLTYCPLTHLNPSLIDLNTTQCERDTFPRVYQEAPGFRSGLCATL